ncbi:uncharacterized protein BX664DRAFT_339561 [Halteromyces radiatus]|uniref:uncharacterized protein n=1 Tax=Halteromyces radiatus TaxID=101107 RepID=UPI00221E4893|nr:uncharacterized protein BX664DRAFT_339561 [Halteromyces radiatus]KAI8082986.1 hypothetical protein BX664DRAFT_339561 [Halteromyces radiatus]
MTANTKNNASHSWLPLEACPEVWNKIIHGSGVDTKWKYVDIENLDSLIQAPLAIIILFPSTQRYNDHIHQEEIRLAKLEQSISPNVIFFKQPAGMAACGMTAMLHSLANNDNEVVGPGVLHDFLETSRSMSPDERADWLQQSNELEHLHQTAASLGQTDVTGPGQCHIDCHYICLVEVDDHLYELDGRRPLPVNHGKTTDFIQSAAKMIKQYKDLEPDQKHFRIIALMESK